MPSPGLNQLIWLHSWVSSSVPRSTQQNRIKSAKISLGRCWWGMEEKARKWWESYQTTTQVPQRRRGRESDGNDSDTGQSKEGLPRLSESSGQSCHPRSLHLWTRSPSVSLMCSVMDQEQPWEVCLRATHSSGFQITASVVMVSYAPCSCRTAWRVLRTTST